MNFRKSLKTEDGIQRLNFNSHTVGVRYCDLFSRLNKRNYTCVLIYENRASKMKLFWYQGFFFVNFDFQNGCKNELQDTNEKLCK